jgi:SAM-dependent methyltransferase
MSRDPTARFSDRVDFYDRARPGYPRAVIDVLVAERGLVPEHRVADVGCGTGKLAVLFLDHGNFVFGVEPNAPMREAAVRAFANRASFRAVDGSAESTGLEPGSIDLVVAGQAFHWFDPARTRPEWTRILVPGGAVALVWNDRRIDASPLMGEYEALLDACGIDYRETDHQRHDESRIAAFFAPGRVERADFAHTQSLDLDGFLARLFSSSYVPGPGHPAHADVRARAEALFRRHEVGGRVAFEYRTRVFHGTLGDGVAGATMTA